MIVIAGLGNPGREYEKTRHNMGFDVIDKLAKEENISVIELKGKGLIGKGVIEGEKCILLKPQTYMNLSGESIREIVTYFKVDPKTELIVVSDDIDLDPGQLRVRPKGSAGGHNGLKDIIKNLGTEEFTRIKIGVGAKPEKYSNLADHVLGRFNDEDRKLVDCAIDNATKAIRTIITEDVDTAMNRFNTKKK